MRYVSVLLCILSLRVSNLQAQRSSRPQLDSLIARFERDDLICQPALDSFLTLHREFPGDALAALYVSRAYGWLAAIGSRCNNMNALEARMASDSELYYLELARKLDPNVRSKKNGFRISDLIGHAYGSRALWYLRDRQISKAAENLAAANRANGFSDALARFDSLMLDALPNDAILFTFGDDDTFPMWYLQLVAGYRRDVTVINLSLIAMNWYQHMINNGIAGSLTPTAFPLVPGTTDTSEIPDEEIREIAFAGLSGMSVPFPIDSAARNDLEKELGHEANDLPQTSAFHASMDNEDFGVSSDMFQRIVRANKWRRPVYLSGDGNFRLFNGIQPYLREEGFAARLFPDTGNAYNAEVGTWVDSARFETALNKAMLYTPYADSIMGISVSACFLQYSLLAHYYQMDSNRCDDILLKLRKAARKNRSNAASVYASIVITWYGAGHAQFKDDVEWIKTALADLLNQQGKFDNFYTRLLYANALYSLHECDALRAFAAKIDPPFHSSGNADQYKQIMDFVQKCH